MQYGRDYTLKTPETLPQYRSDTSSPIGANGFWVRLPATIRQKAVALVMAPAKTFSAARRAVFTIDTYKIINAAPGSIPYFYTPSDFRIVLGTSAKTDALVVASVTTLTPPIAGSVRHAGVHPHHAIPSANGR